MGDQCAAGAIVNFTNVAMDKQASQEVKNDALRFVVHVVGDLHQPLHAGWTSDLGGNRIHVEEGFFENKKVNLHALWDYGLIDRIFKDGGFAWDGYEAELAKDVASGQMSKNVTEWAACFPDVGAQASQVQQCVETIAQESLTLACQSAYYDDHSTKIFETEDLDEGYYATRRPVVSNQLAAGGVRLAKLLRWILSATNAEGAVLV